MSARPLTLTGSRLLRLGAALSGLSLLASCAAPAHAPPKPATRSAAPGYIALERTAGSLAEAPVYTVTLFEDGHVLFEGRAGVKTKGTFSKRIPLERAVALFRQLDAISFWDRRPHYTEERVNRSGDEVIARVASPDSPWDIISARYRGQFKRIDGLFFAPHELIEFKTLLEETVGLAAWIGAPAALPRE